MLDTRKPPLVQLRCWIEAELHDSRAAYASWAATNAEIASFHARRAGYLEAALEVLDWHAEVHPKN